jgi:hypothetical protein
MTLEFELAPVPRAHLIADVRQLLKWAGPPADQEAEPWDRAPDLFDDDDAEDEEHEPSLPWEQKTPEAEQPPHTAAKLCEHLAWQLARELKARREGRPSLGAVQVDAENLSREELRTAIHCAMILRNAHGRHGDDVAVLWVRILAALCRADDDLRLSARAVDDGPAWWGDTPPEGLDQQLGEA